MRLVGLSRVAVAGVDNAVGQVVADMGADLEEATGHIDRRRRTLRRHNHSQRRFAAAVQAEAAEVEAAEADVGSSLPGVMEFDDSIAPYNRSPDAYKFAIADALVRPEQAISQRRAFFMSTTISPFIGLGID